MALHLLLLLCSLFMILGGLGLKEDANLMCAKKEREALLVFKADLYWYADMTNFNPFYDETDEEQKRNCCKWEGVACDNNTGNVTGLSVPWYPLIGKISPSLQHLALPGIDFQSNPIPTFLGSLSNLLSLELSISNLSGPIPHQLANLTNLLHLNLSYNSLSGPIPHQLANLPNLLGLDLSFNVLEGTIPFGFGGYTTSLKHLDLSRNHLNGVIPKSFDNCSSSLVYVDLSENKLSGLMPSFVRCSSMSTLSIAHNFINGSIPHHFTGCISLQKLDLSSNRLIGDLPKIVGQLSNLEYLDVSFNSLRGVISSLFLNLTKLTYLGLSFNSFEFQPSSLVNLPFQLRTIKMESCKLGPSFPTWIRSQRNFARLDISSAGISDSIPAWFLEDLPSGMIFLNLSSNEIKGVLPNLTSSFEGYPGIDLSNNKFEGTVPLLPSTLASLNLSGNKFSGTLSFLCQIEEGALTFLDLSNNLFTGSLPHCWLKFQNSLKILNLSNNSLSGMIPSSLGFLFDLEALYMQKNAFVGELPVSLSNCTALRFVDLGENKLSGVIPKWIGEKLCNLYVLVLETNKFSGKLPLQVCWLYNLQLLDLSKNELLGHIPTCFGNLTGMVRTTSGDMTSHSYSFYMLRNENKHFGGHFILPPCRRGERCRIYHEETFFIDNALVAWKGTKRMFGRTNLELLKSIDLSSNNLSGNFPNEITSLHELASLNLSNNKLNGEVPKDIGHLKFLESLDVSRNQFSGRIPTSLKELTFLSYLDLSYNNLSGKIPEGPQLQGFNSTSYAGNPQLCGPPLTQGCVVFPPVTIAGKEDVEEDGDDFWKSWYIGMAAGFAVGFWGSCCSLFLNRRCRYFFFDMLNHFKDWIYAIGAVHLQKLKRKLIR